MATKKTTNKSEATKSATTKKTAKSSAVKKTATKKSASTKRAAAAKKAGIELNNYFALAQADGATVKIVNGQVVLVGKDGKVVPSKTKTTTRTKTVTTTKVEVVPTSFDSKPSTLDSRRSTPDTTMQRIIDEGHIENASLHRRWVMAQTFRLLRNQDGWLDGLRSYGYEYMWRMLMDECHAIAKMEANNSTQATARKRCFPLESIKAIIELCVAHCDGHNVASFVSLLEDATCADSYAEMAELLKRIYRQRPHKRWFKSLQMPQVFINCYKAAGAYYTMQNMVMFHGCFVHQNGQPLDQYASLDAIEQYAADVCQNGQGWKLFGMMKKLVKDNGFDFQARMREVYGNR